MTFVSLPGSKEKIKNYLSEKRLKVTSDLQRDGMASDSATKWIAFVGFVVPITRLLTGQVRFDALRLLVTEVTFDRGFCARWKGIGAINVFTIKFAVRYDAQMTNFLVRARNCEVNGISLKK